MKKKDSDNLVSAQVEAGQELCFLCLPENHWTLRTNFPIWQRRENILAREGDTAKAPWSQQKQSYRSGCVHLEVHSLIRFPLSLFARRRLNTEEQCSLNRKESAREKGRSLANNTNWESLNCNCQNRGNRPQVQPAWATEFFPRQNF